MKKSCKLNSPPSEPNSDSNIFLNLYNKIGDGEDLLRKITQDILRHYSDFGKALSKHYDYYRELKHGDLASQALVAEDVRK
ncbi:unnamed protein product [Rhizophagus irregularis]|nr:unnamed protein product [Rhizophagus irregularis]